MGVSRVRPWAVVLASVVVHCWVIGVAAQTPDRETTEAECVIGEHSGVPDSDAETAAALTCDALRDLGVDVGYPISQASGESTSYVVNLRRLGAVTIFELRQETATGETVDGRTLQLANIEEVVVAGPRLAEALVQGVPLEDTAGVGNLVGEETREPGQMTGDTYFAVGIVGVALINGPVFATPGLFLSFFYEAPQWSVGSDMIMGVGIPTGDTAYLFIWSVGGRYFFNEDNTAFFAGGGFGWDTIATERWEDSITIIRASATGVGAYGEVGVEFLRMYGSRLIASLRGHIPFFQLVEEYDNDDGETVTDELWVIPVSLSVSYAW